ncbi:hypothetical protein TNCV_2298851 [Trichonephila clavipes]|nr:hypothetical protein TNCV_2298851 [Trichonephila clavipes]
MRTWRNLGDRAKLASFLEIQLATNLATILASLATMLASSEPLLGSSRKQISPLVSRLNDTSGYISGSFCRAYGKDARRCGDES